MNKFLKNITPKLIVTIPVMDEVGYIEKCIESIKNQTYSNYHVIVCINQPEQWWQDFSKKQICKNNQLTIQYLKTIKLPKIEIIDRSSQGFGFSLKEKGVGHARNILFEKALDIADNNDIIMCLDADTTFNSCYFESVIDSLTNCDDYVALSNPYYHKLSGDEVVDRAILRYEIYMRLYVLNLWRIDSPYAFSPLGSAISIKANSLKAIGKIAAKSAGEDFYLLQKLRKHGRILQYNEQFVYPSSRPSLRVPFGTGPAVAEGINNNWERYPIYSFKPFSLIGETYKLFPKLFQEDIPTPMDEFFEDFFGARNLFIQLRKNFKSVDKFVRACHIKIDGLKILQFIKWYTNKNKTNDEKNFRYHIKFFFSENENNQINCSNLDVSINNISLSLLQDIRDKLSDKEQQYRKKERYEPKLPF